jgi:hypothetical protein
MTAAISTGKQLDLGEVLVTGDRYAVLRAALPEHEKDTF